MFKKISLVFACLLLFSVTPVMAQIDYCEGNFNYDIDVDGSDASKFKSDFGRNGGYKPCPPDGPAPVPKTGSGQAQNMYGWDDGCLQVGVPSPSPRFTNPDGTTPVTGAVVFDKLTGLMWTKNADACSGSKTWTQALDCVTSQYNWACYAGYCDWVLPNVRQLQSLIDFGHYNPALPSGHPFTNVQSSSYWSSTTNASNTYNAWYVGMYYGYVGIDNKTYDGYVWPVRGGHDFLGKCAWQ